MESPFPSKRNRRSVAELLGKPLSVVPQHQIRRDPENAFASHLSGAHFATAALRAAVQVLSACVRTPRDDDDLRRDHLAPAIMFTTGVPHRTTLQQHSQLDGGLSFVCVLLLPHLLCRFAVLRCSAHGAERARSPARLPDSQVLGSTRCI